MVHEDRDADTGRRSGAGLLGLNAWLVEEMYQTYRADPASVNEGWQEFFADYRGPAPTPSPPPALENAGASSDGGPAAAAPSPALTPAPAPGPAAAPAPATARPPAPAAEGDAVAALRRAWRRT